MSDGISDGLGGHRDWQTLWKDWDEERRKAENYYRDLQALRAELAAARAQTEATKGTIRQMHEDSLAAVRAVAAERDAAIAAVSAAEDRADAADEAAASMEAERDAARAEAREADRQRAITGERSNEHFLRAAALEEALRGLMLAVERVAFKMRWADEHGGWTSKNPPEVELLIQTHDRARAVASPSQGEP